MTMSPSDLASGSFDTGPVLPPVAWLKSSPCWSQLVSPKPASPAINIATMTNVIRPARDFLGASGSGAGGPNKAGFTGSAGGTASGGTDGQLGGGGHASGA